MTSIFIRTIIIYIVLTIMLKILGKRRIGELEADELVSTLLISEIAAMPISDSNIPLLNAVIPIVFICALEVAISAIKNKSQKIKKMVEGKSLYIIYKGRLIQEELEKNRISIDEILCEMRVQGVTDISEVYYAVLEANGKLSLVRREDGENFAHTLIVDGTMDKEKLKRHGYDEKWVQHRLREQGIAADDVFLMTVRDDGKINVIRKEKT